MFLRRRIHPIIAASPIRWSMKTTDPTSSLSEDDSPPSSLGQLCERSTNYIRENPVCAVFGALAAGFVVGWLLPHREPTWREKYLVGPAHRVKDLFQSAAESAGEGFHAVEDRVADVASNAATVVGKGLRKLKFW
jgi:hypothetical protein